MTNQPVVRRVARALRPGGPEVIEISDEALSPLKPDEALIKVEAAGLNHAETLIRSDTYVIRMPFPFSLGGEGSGVVVDAGQEVTTPIGSRVCWGAVPGSCATYITAPASMLLPIPDSLSFDDAATLPVAGITASGLTRVWPLRGRTAVVWGAAGGVGRMLVAMLAESGVDVIGIASGARMDAVLASGASHALDRSARDVLESARALTSWRGAAAVFDPIGAPTYETSLALLAPGGCLINYGELSGPVPPVNLRELFPKSLFVTKYNGMRWVEGIGEFPGMISAALALAAKRPAVISEIAGRFSLDQVADAYRLLETNPSGKVLVLPVR